MQKERLVKEFYDLLIEDMMDKRVWDLPLLEARESIEHVLSVLTGKTHVWVVESKRTKKLVGVITEHDVLGILFPKKLPPYVVGVPKKPLASLHHGTAETAKDVMCERLVKCAPKDTIRECLTKMSRYGVRRLPVTDNDVIVGEITLHHIIAKYHHVTRKYHAHKKHLRENKRL